MMGYNVASDPTDPVYPTRFNITAMTDPESLPAGDGEFDSLVAAIERQLRMAHLSAVDPAAVARSCLQAVLDSGYSLRPPTSLPPAAATVEDFSGSSSVRDALAQWQRIREMGQTVNAAQCLQLGKRVLKGGEPLLAYDIFKQGIKLDPQHVALRQNLALALARSGAPKAAAQWLRLLVEEGFDDDETHGLLARTHKDLWQAAVDPTEKNRHLQNACSEYRYGYQRAIEHASLDGQIYNGINLATMTLLLGHREEATTLAKEIQTRCFEKMETDADYWTLATLGEASLILCDYQAAGTYYQRAFRAAGSDLANLASTRRNAEILVDFLQADPKLLSDWFPIPAVAVFSGHLIDLPDRSPRFEHTQIESVRKQLKQLIQEENVGISYSAAACGSDLLFLNAMANLETRIVLPLPVDRFLNSSVSVDVSHDWTQDFSEACSQATRVIVVNDFCSEPEPIQIEYANAVMTGLAMIHAHSLGTNVVPIAVWDEQPARGPGGTGSMVRLWKELGWHPRVINPRRLAADVSLCESPSEQNLPTATSATMTSAARQQICAMLFADVVGYSKLTDEEIPKFVREFMGALANCISSLVTQPLSCNTWGDAVYLVFSSVESAGLAALEMMETIAARDWMSLGFQRQLSLRIGLHVGPVFQFEDPVTRNCTHTGAHVSRAARIEPIAPPGEVYASEAFAALAAADRVAGFRCDYVGVTPMAKNYGEFPTYHVRRV